MSERDDGGPAFPSMWENDGDQNIMAPDGSVVPPGHAIAIPGMSLRDYFAAQALAGITAAMSAHIIDGAQEEADTLPSKEASTNLRKAFENLSLFAYGFADAMLKARKQ
jgi:hypothetical protein